MSRTGSTPNEAAKWWIPIPGKTWIPGGGRSSASPAYSKLPPLNPMPRNCSGQHALIVKLGNCIDAPARRRSPPAAAWYLKNASLTTIAPNSASGTEMSAFVSSNPPRFEVFSLTEPWIGLPSVSVRKLGSLTETLISVACGISVTSSPPPIFSPAKLADPDTFSGLSAKRPPTGLT